ncbi:D-alanyl-D-alanine carboxypeptidase/D-alanyl-D-alanine-endopeptidase [uncultured Porphyromonas sp.]|uniref:D-alanyl-D-alanine carboxypeptidase/D-alanyl-D-alanine endopeptidase n=1 Tax=uncultured Porphyromonas sp. TaxID=159274 RepID=UPI002621719F|nr:D-alanyl-D-alanine carboxypeptidase/D-alanyl-D-alanine-endopeptidase [uncultured Porphyromonas sp.]
MMRYKQRPIRIGGLLLLLHLLLLSPASAQRVKVPSEPAALSQSFWTLSIQDAESGQELVGIRSHHLATPASTMKLISTATLWSQKGGGLRIPTEIHTTGTIAQGKLEGDLYIVGHGDPSIGSRYFWNSDQDRFFKEVASALKAKGITQIKGNIIALSPESDFQAVNPRWIAYDMGNAYAPGLWSLNAYDNSYALHFSHYGKSYEVSPAVPELKLQKAYQITSSRSRDSLYISPFPHPDGSYDITGAYPERIEKLRVRAALPNPPLFVADRLRQVCQGAGIEVAGEARVVRHLPPETQLLFTYQSAPLRTLIQITLHYSHNLFAEGLLRQLTWDKAPRPGHNATQTAIEEVHRYWSSRGINTRELEMMDGSGLSPENRVSAYFLATMLGKIERADPSGSFRSLLPRAGMEGTLSHFLKGTPLQGKARLKSGTLRNVICYAGYVEIEGHTYTVALMVNNFYGSSSTIRRAMEDILLSAFGY